MKHILTASGRALLADYVRLGSLLAFDFDGTLAPIVRLPATANMRAQTRALLASLAMARPVAVISGRSRADIAVRIAGVSPIEMIGNHGLEPSDDAALYAARVRHWMPGLLKLAKLFRGVLVEDKGGSVSVHYRDATKRRQARLAIEHHARQLGRDVRMVGGKMVVNFIPSGAPHKGTALEHLRLRLGAPASIYVGDDVTDEDVFALGQDNLLSIRVGRSRRSAARYFLRNQREIDDLLAHLVEAVGNGPHDLKNKEQRPAVSRGGAALAADDS